MPSLLIIILLTLLTLINSEVLIPRCNICLRCTYCASDVLYDCSIDSIYTSISLKNPTIASAFPKRITKTIAKSSIIYSFQFSNDQNISYQIVNKNSSINQTKILSQTQNSSNNTNYTSYQSTSQPATWTAIENSTKILLNYIITHFHLSPSSTITSIQQETSINTYSFIVKSLQSIIKMVAIIDKKDYSVNIINMTYINGPLLSASSDTVSLDSKQTGPILSVSSNNVSFQSSSKSKSILTANGLVISQTLKQLLNYLLNTYSQLTNFELSSYSTFDNFSYNLTISNIAIPSIKYIFQVLALTPVSDTLAGKVAPSPSYQIMSYDLINSTNPSNFTILNTSQLLHSNPFAQMVINQVQSQIIQSLQLQNVILVNISASTPFYVLFYQTQAQVFRFLVSYDVLTSKIRVIQQKISSKSNKVTLQQPKPPITLSSSTQTNNLALAMTQIREKNASLTTSNNATPIKANSSSLPQAQDILPPIIQVKQVPTSSSPLTYINFRVDPVFLKAASALSNLYDFNRSTIVKVSSIDLPNLKQYTITINLNLPSNKLLQFTADYNTTSKSINGYNFLYTPQTTLDPNLFQSINLSDIGSNKIVMSTISSIFLQYPQYFSTSVSSVLQVMAFPPYFNITYNNSAFGLLRFDCQYNYLTNNTTLLNFSIQNVNNTSSLSNDIFLNPSTNTNPSINTNTKTNLSSVMTNATEVTAASPSSTDLFCISYKNEICSQCTFRFYYDTTKEKCVSVQDWCYQFDYTLKICTNCFSGYTLINGSCHLP